MLALLHLTFHFEEHLTFYHFCFRYDEIKDKLTPYLKKCGFNPKTDIFYLPVSGLTGINLKDHNPIICPWYK